MDKSEVYSILREKIILGDYKPGQILKEKELMKEFNIGRTPLRELLVRLDAEGLVEIIPYSGVYISSIELQQLMDVMEVRRPLIRIAGRLAAERATKDEIEKMKNFLDKFKDNLDEKELIKIILIDFYEKGIQVLESLNIYDKCPFCDKEYEGNLLEYISGKQEKLRQLKEQRVTLESMKKDILCRIDTMIRKIEDFTNNLRELELSDLLTNLRGKAINFKFFIEKIKPSLQHPIEKGEKIDVNKIDWESYQYLLDYQQQVQDEIKTRITELEEDKSRKREDFHHDSENTISRGAAVRKAR